MSENHNQTSVTRENDVSDFPVAAIVCLSVGGYVILVMIFLIIKRLMMSKGMFQFSCCCAESIPACCVCEKLDEVCQPCCCSSCREGFLATMCGIDKETKCKDIFCCCCTCQEGCCDPCTDMCPTGLYCCHHQPKCCACDSDCPSCFGNDLDPNACGCLCLEIKLRTAHRSSSAPPRANQNQNINVDVSPDDLSNHVNSYYTGKLNGSSADRTIERSQIQNNYIREKERSSSHSPAKAATHFYQTSPEKLNAFNILDIPEGQNPIHVNFGAALGESPASRELQQQMSSAKAVSSSAPGDLLPRSSMNGAIRSEMEPGRRPTSRSRRLIRPGQISQRFPNKVLVSSESLNFCCLEKMKNVTFEVSLISNNEQLLSNAAIQYDAANLHRPLPTLKRTI